MKIKDIRKKRGYTQGDLSTLTGISLNSITSYEQGLRNIDGAKLEILLKMCLLLNCKLEDIVESEELIDLIQQYNKRILKKK